MGSFWNILFSLVLLATWIIAGGFVTDANVQLGQNGSKEPVMEQAYWYTFGAAFTTWTLVGIFIILIILSIIGIVSLFGTGVGEVATLAAGAKATLSNGLVQGVAKAKFPWLTFLVFGFSLVLVIITGILAVLAANNIRTSTEYDENNERIVRAYKHCIIGASMCLGAAGLLVIGIITYFTIAIVNKNKAEKAAKEVEAKNRENLEMLNDYKKKVVIDRALQKVGQKETLIAANNLGTTLGAFSSGYQALVPTVSAGASIGPPEKKTNILDNVLTALDQPRKTEPDDILQALKGMSGENGQVLESLKELPKEDRILNALKSGLQEEKEDGILNALKDNILREDSTQKENMLDNVLESLKPISQENKTGGEVLNLLKDKKSGNLLQTIQNKIDSFGAKGDNLLDKVKGGIIKKLPDVKSGIASAGKRLISDLIK